MKDLTKYINRAVSATGHGIKYKLGKGGYFPNDPLPTRTKTCDCSGYVSWVLGMSRIPKLSRPWWVETTNVYRDATTKQKCFVQIDTAVPGCIVVFPDRNGHEGHIGIVETVNSYNNYTVIDCASKGITVQSGKYFRANHAIFCVLKQDV